MDFRKTGDDVTDQNLDRLFRFSNWGRFTGNADQMHEWICGVIETIEMLPSFCKQHLSARYHIGDRHYKCSDAHRAEMWESLADSLKTDLQTLQIELESALTVDWTDRKQSLGEKILILCDEFQKGSRPRIETASRIEAISFGDIKGDAQELGRLLSKKRVTDLSSHNYEIARTINRIRIIATNITGQSSR